jgi:type I restriction enzyme S subunit
MEGYQNTEIGLLPNEWDFGRIDDYFTVQQGKQVSKSNRIGENQKPFLRTSNILWGMVVFDELDHMHFSEQEEVKFQLEKNDLLVCEGGDIGRTAIWNNEVENCYYQNHLHRLRAKTDEIDPVFILQWLEYSFVYGNIYFGRGNITTIPNLSKSRLSELIIPQPELPEQRKIAQVLSKVQKAIEQQDKLIRTTTELKKALMQKLFTEGTRGESQRETEIGLVPESWEVVKMEECLLQTQYGLSAKGNEKGNVPILRMTNQKDGYISDENLQYVNISEKEMEKFKVNTDDVIFNRTNSFELVGRTAIFKLSGDYIFASYLIRLITNSKKLYPEFLNFYLNADETQNRLKSIATRGVSQSNISATRLRGFVIPLLSLAEQLEIISTMKTFNQKIEYQNKKKQTLTALFKTLLHELMTGQRRVHELEFEKMEDFNTL